MNSQLSPKPLVHSETAIKLTLADPFQRRRDSLVVNDKDPKLGSLPDPAPLLFADLELFQLFLHVDLEFLEGVREGRSADRVGWVGLWEMRTRVRTKQEIERVAKSSKE